MLDLSSIDGFEFEDLCASIFRKLGYENVNVTQRTNDMGKDIIMTKDNYPVVVECKHQKFVGRPIIQKLQGAMQHEVKPGQFIKGIVITSGSFAPTVPNYVRDINNAHKYELEIELIDGKQLKSICEQHNIIILNGKIQIITDNTVEHIDKDVMNEEILKDYKKIIGSKNDFIKTDIKFFFYPAYFIRYNINSAFYTSIGLIYTINRINQSVVIDSYKGGLIDEDYKEHFFHNSPKIVQEPKEKDFKPFEFTEKDVNEIATSNIIELNTDTVTYRGRNNQSYSKVCRPKKTDIEILEGTPVYLPILKNKIKILKHTYHQEVLSNQDNLLYMNDQLEDCYVSKRKPEFFKELYLCNTCGKVLCTFHKRLDYIDKTPVCQEDAIKRRLLLQIINFQNKHNAKEWDKLWLEKNIFQKIITDKIVSIAIAVVMILLIGIVLL